MEETKKARRALMRKGLKIAVSLVVLAIILSGFAYAAKYCFSQQGVERETITIRNEIENAIEFKRLENKFIYIQAVAFGGAGAGGLGAPQIFTKSAEQFAELVPADEPVYAAFEHGKYSDGSENRYVFMKVYWAFIENRAGLMVYEDIYQYNHWRVESYNQNEVIFSYPYGAGFWFLGLLTSIVGLVVLVGGVGWIVYLNLIKDPGVSFWNW